jgi:hypothetical protein
VARAVTTLGLATGSQGQLAATVPFTGREAVAVAVALRAAPETIMAAADPARLARLALSS